MSSLAAKLKKNTKVKITTKGQYNGQVGLVKYVGPIEQKKADGDYVGLQLEKPVGKNNGTHNGKEYFKTKPNHGIFLKPTSLALMDGTPVVPPVAPVKAPTANKLSKDLEQAEKVPQKTEQVRQEQSHDKTSTVPAAKQQKQPQTTESSDHKTEIDQLKKKVKALQQEARTLRMQNEKVKYAVKDKDEGKQNELKQQIEFYKGQKEAIQKQKADLKKKNAQLNAQLEEYAQNVGMVDTLTIKIQTLQSKNQKLKQELETANSELKNFKMMGESSGKNQAQLSQNMKILNETVTLLESDLKQMTDKYVELQAELKKKQTIDSDYKKLQRKLKQKEQELQQMANQLQLMSDTANFVQKLTMNMLKKDEQLKEATEKLTQYLGKYQILENQLALNKQFSEELNQQLFQQQELMDKYSKQIQEKNKHIMEMSRQVEKYKKKLFEATQTNESSINASQIVDDKEDISISKMIFGGDQYQNKYYSLLKVNNQIRKSQLSHLIQFSQIRNQIGVYVLNLTEALPESFTQKLQPNVISLLTSTKSANDKLYYIFTTVAETFKNKSDIYSKENSELAQWLIILLKQVITLYGCLHKIQFTLTTADTEEQISLILEHRVLKQQLRRVNDFALQILQRFVDDNISANVDLETFISSIQKFDDMNISIKKNFSIEHSTKMKLCSDAMETVTNILESILKYKHTNPLGQNAEVDNSLEIFLKTILTYVKECCMNPYVRFKSQMKDYLKGLNLISSILAEIAVQGNFHELNSLYSETENIKMLRETILTTQFHANALENDLKDIVYKSEVDKIQTQLTGKFWQDRIKLIRQQLLKVKQISQQKVELEHQLNQSKKKILILERDLKDKQSTKQLYEKRIGQLQLKVEQVSSIENENKRQAQKIKSYEDANKVIEEQIVSLQKKYKFVEEENRKIKQKYDTLQTETMMRNKKQRNVAAMSSEDVANLTIFKNVIKQSNQLRTIEIKKKMMNLKQSPIYLAKKNARQDDPQVAVTRAKVFDQISKFTINDPFNPKKNANEANLDLVLKEIDKLKANIQGQKSTEEKVVKVGELFIGLKDINEASLSLTGLSIIVN